MTTNPLILTLIIDDEAQAFFNELRKRYFPPERNFLDAHLTLFHQLPADKNTISTHLKTLAAETKIFELPVTGLMSTGNGVAYKVESTQLSAIHKQMQLEWQQWLIPQDKQTLQPHITIQNKVNPDVAKALLNNLTTEFRSFIITAQGFALWEYLGGPWKFVEKFEFTLK